MFRTGHVGKTEGHADGCIYDFAVNRGTQAGRSGPAHSRDNPFTIVFCTAKPDKTVHRSICGLAPCFSARDPCIFCPRTVLRVRGQAITTAS